jgi:hypothetical protein
MIEVLKRSALFAAAALQREGRNPDAENRVDASDRVFRRLRLIRATGLLTVLLVVLAGGPEPTVANQCYPWLIQCTHSVDDCVADGGESCWQPEGCNGKVYCRPSFQYVGCSDYEYMIMCEEEKQD